MIPLRCLHYLLVVLLCIILNNNTISWNDRISPYGLLSFLRGRRIGFLFSLKYTLREFIHCESISLLILITDLSSYLFNIVIVIYIDLCYLTLIICSHVGINFCKEIWVNLKLWFIIFILRLFVFFLTPLLVGKYLNLTCFYWCIFDLFVLLRLNILLFFIQYVLVSWRRICFKVLQKLLLKLDWILDSFLCHYVL